MPSEAAAIAQDFAFEMWVYQYYKIVIAMVLFWLFYVYNRNPCTVDVGYVCNHFIVGTSLFISVAIPFYIKPVILYAALTIWWLRLAGFLVITRILKGYRDPRYEKLSENASNKLLFFFINYQFQAIIVVITSSPLYFVFRNPSYINPYTFSIGLTMIIIGIIFEAISDYQLNSWKARMRETRETPGKKEIMQEGLWKYSRHPNLFFELMTWFGFALTGVNNQWIELLSFIGPCFLVLTMNYVTVPISEEHMRETREDYPDFCKKTNKFLPFKFF